MKRIADIKQRREDRFWENRMKLARVQKQQDIEREVLVHGDLLSDKEKKLELVERIKEREVERKEAKEELRKKHKGTIRIEEEL
jgi:hypothetical protein